MSHSYPNIVIHCAFTTKERTTSIPAELQEKLWRYLAKIGVCHKLPILAVGETANHVQLLLALPAEVPLCKAIHVLKANSSRWMGEHGIDFGGNKGMERSA